MDIDVILTPSDIARVENSSPGADVCVVFDVLRATSTIVTALNNGAKAIIPVKTIEEAIELKKVYPEALLAGERNGLKISASMSGEVEFDLGNSPREFIRQKVSGRIIITTTTNGTRAIESGMLHKICLVASFLNLSPTAGYITESRPGKLLIICSGTREEPALEDIICAGALIDLLGQLQSNLSDAAMVYNNRNLTPVVCSSKNAKRLLGIPELAADVTFCLQRDIFNVIAIARNKKIVRI